MESQLAQMRVDYRRDELDVGDLAGTWHEQLARWLADATAAGVVEPNAMVLATAVDDCTPSSRTVLCKDVDERGVVFYTNYTSAKSHELRSMPPRRGHLPLVRAATPGAACAATSSGSPRRRPAPTGRRGRAGRSWVRGRRRSRPTCATADALDAALAATERRFADTAEVPVPPHWGGWRIVPDRVEFWQGRAQPDARPAAVRAERDRPVVAGAPAGALTVSLAERTAGYVWKCDDVAVVVLNRPVTPAPDDDPTRPLTRRGPTRRRGGSPRPCAGALADTRPLRTPAYRRLWSAGIVTVVGAQLTVVAVPTQIYQLTGSSAYVGLTGALRARPARALRAVGRRDRGRRGPAGPAAAHRRGDRGHVAGPVGRRRRPGAGGVWLVLVLFAVQSAFLAVNQPTRSAVIPRLLPAEQLPAANALNMTVVQAGAVAGPLLAGVLIPVVGLSTLYLFDAIALLATLWATWRLPPVPPAAPEVGASKQRAGASARSSTGSATSPCTRSCSCRSSSTSWRWASACRAWCSRRWRNGLSATRQAAGSALGLLFAAIPIGMVVAGLLSGWLHRVTRQGVAVTVAICVWGIGVALFGLTHSLWFAVLFLAVAGAGDLVSSVFRSSMLQTVATDEMRGRMQGVFIVVVAGGPRIADLWHGPAAAAFGSRAGRDGGRGGRDRRRDRGGGALPAVLALPRR